MEKGSLSEMIDVMIQGEVSVKNDTEVVSMGGWGEEIVADLKGDVVDGFGEGFGADDYKV